MAAPSFLECVGAVAREARELAEAELIDIAYWSRASQGTLSRFERAEAQPRDLDRLLTAYAKVSGRNPADLLREAVERWEAGGGAELPEVTPTPRKESSVRRAAQAAERLAERDRQKRDAAREAQPGRRRRQA